MQQVEKPTLYSVGHSCGLVGWDFRRLVEEYERMHNVRLTDSEKVELLNGHDDGVTDRIGYERDMESGADRPHIVVGEPPF